MRHPGSPWAEPEPGAETDSLSDVYDPTSRGRLQRHIGGRSWDFARQIAVMAIVNRTKDSFFDEGRTFALDRAVEAGLTAAAVGADIIDVGGVPFSPAAEAVTPEQERQRVVPVVEPLADQSEAVISVDTRRAEVAAACIEAGAAIVNDTSGVQDPAMAELVAGTGVQIVVTHTLAAPGQVVRRPAYDDVVIEVRDHLSRRIEDLLGRGVRPDQILIDPGPDLNKNTRHTLDLCRRFNEITALGYPCLVAVSNKDFIGETLDRAKPDRLVGTVAATSWCVAQGGRILRVHDVLGGLDTARMCEALLGERGPAYLRHNMD